KKSFKTVFFGTFVGEFGWELLWWQGWVRRVCRTRYKGWRIIASSFPGRHVFYPEAEFWPLPRWFLEKPISSRVYITDCWKNNWPSPNIETKELEDVKPKIDRIITDFKKKLPKNTVFIIPWKFRNDKEYGKMGMIIPENPKKDDKFIAYNIAYSDQDLEYLKPSKKGQELFDRILENSKNTNSLQASHDTNSCSVKQIEIQNSYDRNSKRSQSVFSHNTNTNYFSKKNSLIAIFPRMRKYRRPDKNWEKEKYLELIEKLQKRFCGNSKTSDEVPYNKNNYSFKQTEKSQYKIAILGEPGGAFFADSVPDGCIDLINVPADYRMDIQCAALNQSKLAIGSQSGAIDFALACGCPSISWGPGSGEKVFLTENFMKTPMTFLPFQNPHVDTVLRYAGHLLGYDRKPVGFEIKKRIISGFYANMPNAVMKSGMLSKIKKRVAG
ncbi:MAG: hypothetical protein HZB65_02620, partial [Candidatus Aenigmarchaeota archaeon]|nr:hypothetical protein [Candidatus Aenigmarchaeota archaeon]